MRKIILFVTMLLFSTNICFANVNVHIVPNGNVTNHQIEVVVNAINYTTSHMQKKYGKKLGKNIKIYLGTEAKDVPNMFSAMDINQNIGGKSMLGTIKLIIPENSTDYYITFLTAHELVHQYQAIILGGTDVLKKNMWFTEGMADVIGAEVAKNVDASMFKVFEKNASKSIGTCNLSNITSKGDWSTKFNIGEHIYAKADSAVLYLYNNFPHDNLFLYLSVLYNKSASDALASVYGLSIEDLDNILNGNYYEEASMPDNITSISDYDFIAGEPLW